jgi:hypothetical protein
VYFTVFRIMNRNRGAGVIDEHLLASAVLLPQDQVQLLQPSPVEFAKPAVSIAVRIALAAFLPDQLQCQVLVRLQVFVDLGPIRFRVFPPYGRSRPLGK